MQLTQNTLFPKPDSKRELNKANPNEETTKDIPLLAPLVNKELSLESLGYQYKSEPKTKPTIAKNPTQ